MTVDELIKNQGAWHKSCYAKFSKEKLQRATKKRDMEETAESCASGENGLGASRWKEGSVCFVNEIMDTSMNLEHLELMRP